MQSQTTLALEKGLPSNVDAERFVLGSILLDDSAFLDVAGQLEPEDFCLDKHRKIFPRMVELHERSERIDRITLANELLRFNELESVDGLTYLVSLDDGLPKIPNLDSYIKIIRDKAVLRRIITASQHMMNRCLLAEEDPEQILAGAEETLLKLGESQVERGPANARRDHRQLRGRHQRLPRPQQADQGHQHRLHQVRRDDWRPARRRTDHSGRAALHGQDGARAEYCEPRGDQVESEGRDFFARNVGRVAADPHAVRFGVRG